ncbi:Sec-independent protein translocase protein TatB [Parvibaculum sp.]|uniref:Sec-independent protein translocase protein TatB n=1 Tax=Parvibaculum sp. TaxID=2024848 RepID=UPI00329692D3
MFDIGWSELMALVVIAIVFVGPRDLPRMMRTAGQYAAKVRAMAREFQNSFEDLARETELDELRKEVSDLRGKVTEPMRSLQREMDKPVKIGGGGAGAAASAVSATKAEEKRGEPLDTGDVSEGIAEAIREAEAVDAYEASEPMPAGDITAEKRAQTKQEGE